MASAQLLRLQELDHALGGHSSHQHVPCMGIETVQAAMLAVASARMAKPTESEEDIELSALVEDCQIVYDMDAVVTTATSLKAAFDSALRTQLGLSSGEWESVSPFMHCFAVKSCPIAYILHTMVRQGLGLECASIVEVHQSLRCGCPANRVVFDSPCKTMGEISEALELGVNMNINSVKELEKVQQIFDSLPAEQRDRYTRGTSFLGLRVNPLVGAGSIAALSVATPHSKFGIPIYNSEYIVNIFEKHLFLNGVMCHVGSQGMSVGSMVRGVRAMLDVAEMIERSSADKRPGTGIRIRCFDIGGGLPVNYTGDSVSPSFGEYAQALLVACPELFEHADVGPDISRPSNRWKIVTEFGKALISKTACVVARVEDVIYHNETDGYLTELDVATAPVREPLLTAVIHAGADLFLRQCYCPEKFPHRCILLDHSNFEPVKSDSSRRFCSRVAVAGPLCFGGDVVQLAAPMHVPVCGDFVVALDAGANTISLFSRHCSRPSPAVFAVRRLPRVGGVLGEQMIACLVRNKESTEDICAFWG